MPIDAENRIEVSVVIPTWQRKEELAVTLDRIMQCDPLPAEILVHVDAGDIVTGPWLRAVHPDVQLLESEQQVGPGGGRNKLIRAAKEPIVVSFDDDSYPLDTDFFRRIVAVFNAFPQAALLSYSIIHRDEEIIPLSAHAGWTSMFTGCACAYRRDVFLTLDGYLDLPVAYAAEEADLAIQLYAANQRILCTSWLRVFHNTYRLHHESARVNAGTITNLALLAYVRYPASMWGYAAIQVLNRIRYSIRMGRYAGILTGISRIPGRIWHFRTFRRPVGRSVMKRYLEQRATIETTEWPGELAHYPESVTPICPTSAGVPHV